MLLLCIFVTLFTPLKALCQNNEKTFDSLLTAQFPADGPGGVALVAKEGKIIYEKAFGKVNLELNVPMKTDNVFRIGSNTKQFTAIAIFKLAEEGKLSIHDDITKFIKDYPTQGKTITIEDLLTHTSGIKNYTGVSKWTKQLRRTDLTPKELVDFFKNEPMDFSPGEEYRYDNSGYILLGYIIELVSGKTYAQYINENFFQLLGMKNSFYDDPSKIIRNRASGYKKNGDHFENSDFLSMTLPYAAGSLLSTVDDFFIWYQAVTNLKVINKNDLEKAQTSYKLKSGKLTGYGYGWETGNVQGRASIKHVGVVNGFVTYAAYLPVEKIFIAIFSNCECAGDLDYPASKIAAILLNKPYQYNKIELPVQQLEACQGVYHTAYNGDKIITCQDGQLVYCSKGGRKSQLIPFKKDMFFIENSLISFKFQRNSKGNVIGFDLNNTGMPDNGIRTDAKIKSINQIHIDMGLLEKYAGKYEFASAFIFYVDKEGDKLYGRVGDDKKEIIPFDTNKFIAKDLDATIIFNLDANGNVTGLTKIQSSEMTAKRIN